jgi:hypothetical protein
MVWDQLGREASLDAAQHATKMVEVPGFEPCFHREAKSLADADLIGGYNLRTGRLEQPSARK